MTGPQEPIRQRMAQLRGADTSADADALLRRLVISFLSRTPAELDRLAGAIRDGDARAAATGAHRLHGSAANLGAARLAAQLADVDGAARAGRLASAGGLLPAVREAYAETERVLRRLLVDWPEVRA